MSYRCQVCEVVVPAGQSLLKHVVKRPDGQIDREVPVCPDCAAELAAGKPVAVVRRLRGPKVDVPDALRHLPRAVVQAIAPPPKPVQGTKINK